MLCGWDGVGVVVLVWEVVVFGGRRGMGMSGGLCAGWVRKLLRAGGSKEEVVNQVMSVALV